MCAVMLSSGPKQTASRKLFHFLCGRRRFSLAQLPRASSSPAGAYHCRTRRNASPTSRFSVSVPSVATISSSCDSSEPLRVCIVGGGAAGLTSALRLLQLRSTAATSSREADSLASPDALKAQGEGRRLRSVEVTVVASGFGTATTTAGAAGLWGPYKLSDTPEELINRWGAATYEHLMQLSYSRQAASAGVSLCSVNSFYSEPEPLPFWRGAVHNFELMGPRQLELARRVAPPASSDPRVTAPPPEPLPCNWGYYWNSVVCEGARYLPWLEAQVTALGGRLVRLPERLTSLGQLSGSEVDVVVNAAGLGAGELLGDDRVYPIRGQILRVRAPWVRQAYFFGPYYIIPNRDTVVLGGTGQVGDYNLQPSPEDTADILQGCTRLLPSLADAELVSEWVGLRPGRTALRLELQRGGARLAGGKVVPVIHNYGHGGSGLTLAWGCAGDVVRLMEEEGLLGAPAGG